MADFTLTPDTELDPYLPGTNFYQLLPADNTDRLIVDWSSATSPLSLFSNAGGADYSTYIMWGNRTYGSTYRSVSVTGSGGDDTFGVLFGPSPLTAVDGGAGYDLFSFQSNNLWGDIAIRLTLDTTPGAVSIVEGLGLQLTNVEALSIAGRGGEDVITGGSYADSLGGGGGNDIINGGGGDDLLYSGLPYYDAISTNDQIDGGDGYDIWTGGHAVNPNFAGDANFAYQGGGRYLLTYDYAQVFGNIIQDAEVSVQNVEELRLTTTGNQTISLGSHGIHYLTSIGGHAALTVDWSDQTGSISGLWERESPYLYLSRIAGSNQVTAENYQQLTLLQGAGNDGFRFYATDSSRIVHIDGGAGFDSVSIDLSDSSTGVRFSLTMAAGVASALVGQGSTLTNVEQVSFTGGSGNDQIGGGSYNDILSGGDGDDVIEGGAGNDILRGGGGTDSLSYQHATAGVSVSLMHQGLSVDTGGAGTDFFLEFENLRGSAFADHLTGNDGSNVLSGLDGADVMTGLGGDDVYYIDNVLDQVIEADGRGYDSLFTKVSYSLQGTHAEAMTLLGRGHINAAGNALDNVLTGNAGANVIDGGAGADLMIGGAGRDTYYVDNVDDVVSERLGEGIDTIYSSVSYGLAGQFVEILELTGSANIHAVGNSQGNQLIGNAGNNVLNGKCGNDVLTGGAGRDHFVFDTTLGGNNVDRITDFNVRDDTIRLDDAVFDAIGPLGRLNADAFVIGAAALDAADRVVYNSATGDLFYDADGSGGAAAILFAQVMPGLALTNADFLVV